MRDPANAEFQNYIANNDSGERLLEKATYFWPFALMRAGECVT
jgi:hypothetical protein